MVNSQKNIFMKQILIAILFIISNNSWGQIQPNDFCGGAALLPVTASCINNTFSMPSASFTNDIDPFSCNSGARDDGWYSFVATGNSTTITVSATQDIIIHLYSACGFLLTCADFGLAGVPETINYSTVIGTTYRIRIQRYNSSMGITNGNICIYSVTPPTNDNCPNPISLSNAVSTAGTTTNASISASDPSPWCVNVIAKNTVWYTFTTPASMGTLNVTLTPGSMTYSAISIFEGYCGAFTEIGCNSPNTSGGSPSITISCLAQSTTYYIMVWTDFGSPGTFNITATYTAGGGAVANDCCTNATPLSNGVNLVGQTNINAAVAPDDPLPSCRGYFWLTNPNPVWGLSNATVWYSFTTPAYVGTLNVTVTKGTIAYAGVSVHTGNCGNLVEIGCNSQGDALRLNGNPTVTLTCLQPSTKYFIMVWNDEGTLGTFSINATYTAGGSPPANDNFSNATNLTLGTTLSGQTTSCSSIESGENTACAINSPIQSIWYKFTATATTTFVEVINTSGGSCYVNSAIWSNSTLPPSNNFCGMESCQSSSYGDGQISNLNNTIFQLNTIIGTVYHISIMNGTSCGSAATFNILVSNSAPAGNISNVSTQLPTSPTVGCYIDSPTADPALTCSTGSCPAYSMVTGAGNSQNLVSDAYYSFSTGATLANDISFQNCISSTCGAGNTDWLIWQIYDATGTTCLTSGNLDEILTVANVGCTSSYILHYMWEPVDCDYTNQTPFIDNFGSTSCLLLPVPIELTSFTAELENKMAHIKWSTASEHNNDYFTVLKSYDANIYKTIVKVDGAGNSNIPLSYSIIDNEPITQTTYYQLKQTDFDGKYSFSDVKIVKPKTDLTLNNLNVYNDNLNQQIQISFNGIPGIFYNYSIYDITGHSLRNGNILVSESAKGNYIINTNEFAAGLYSIIINDNETILKQKLIITK
jgi:hypothetical protein